MRGKGEEGVEKEWRESGMGHNNWYQKSDCAAAARRKPSTERVQTLKWLIARLELCAPARRPNFYFHTAPGAAPRHRTRAAPHLFAIATCKVSGEGEERRGEKGKKEWVKRREVVTCIGTL